MEKIKTDKEILNFLIDSVRLAYIKCKIDRSCIHKYEWDNASVISNTSVLMEVELKKTDIIATVFRLLSNDIEIEKALILLLENALLESNTILNWMFQEGNNYPKYLGLIHAIEHLRFVSINYCKTRNAIKC